MIKVGIVGATGYTGAELMRLLAEHPEAQLVAVTSRSDQGSAVTDMYPHLRGVVNLHFVAPEVDNLADCNVVFFATPHGVAQKLVPDVLRAGIKVIDLSADFRIRDVALWESWYGQTHGAKELIKEAIYGLPEFNRQKLISANLVACAGCYPTSVQIGLLPLLSEGCIDVSDIIANAASGVSGAGRQAKLANLHTEVSENFRAYSAFGHRHLPEIEQGLTDIAGNPVTLTFVPHLLPINRGIHTTLYADLTDLTINVQALFEEFFATEPFVDVLPEGSHPQTRSVRGSNYCQVSVHRPGNGSKVVVLVVEDNLVKGASGQAIQCMNIMFGYDETMGLSAAGLIP